MSDLVADHIIDRTRLRRKLSFWRIVAALAVIIVVVLATWRIAGEPQASRSHIARIALSGLITGDRDTLKLIRDVEKSGAAGVVVAIESPGGTTTGSEKVYEELRRLSAKKPVVAVIGTTGASGAYIAAMGADRIVAHGNSLVGSIGVLFQYPDLSGILNTLGVRVEEVKSSPLKAAPNPFEPTSPAARAALESLVTDSYDWFKGLVRERRAMDDRELAIVTDGRVFTGRQALQLKLIDQIGGEREAIAWLESEKKVEKDLPVREWRRPSSSGWLSLLSLSAAVADGLGLPGVASALRQADLSARAGALDGLLAVWHGRLNG